MSDQRRFHELLGRLREGDLDRKALSELEELVTHHLDLRRDYVDYILICSELRLRQRMPATQPENAEESFGQADESAVCSREKADVQDIKRRAEQRLRAFLAEQHREQVSPARMTGPALDLAYTKERILHSLALVVRFSVKTAKALAACLAIGLFVLIIGGTIRSRQVIAVLQETSHAVWETPPNDVQLRREWLALEQGFARLAFPKGIEVILQAPCAVRLKGPNRLFLEQGNLSATLPPGTRGFRVDTPASQVIDHGTHFGVMVDTDFRSEVHVFEGQVELKPNPGTRTHKPRRLTEGLAGLVDLGGRVNIQRVQDRPAMFVKTWPSKNSLSIPGRQLDLTDLLRGGNGYGGGRDNHMIFASTGQCTARHAKLHTTWRHPFAPVHALPYIDGVFIPDGGEGAFSITSLGHSFRGCPDTDGMWCDGFISAHYYRGGQPLRVDLSAHGDVEEGWVDWNSGTMLSDVALTRSFSCVFDSEFTVAFDSVDTRNRAQMPSTIPLHDLLEDDFKDQHPVVMRFQNLNPGMYLLTSYHHDPLEDSSSSDGTLRITVRDARGLHVVADQFNQSWGPKPHQVASATFDLIADGNEVVVTFMDNDDARHNEAHVNGFELDTLHVTNTGSASPSASSQALLQTALYMYANVGMTFDLATIRESLTGIRVSAFSAQCGLLPDPWSSGDSPTGQACFWVLVDGRLRLQHTQTANDPEWPIQIELDEHDRFLTLVTTDGGDGHESDRCYFAQPVLELQPYK